MKKMEKFCCRSNIGNNSLKAGSLRQFREALEVTQDQYSRLHLKRYFSCSMENLIDRYKVNLAFPKKPL